MIQGALTFSMLCTSGKTWYTVLEDLVDAELVEFLEGLKIEPSYYSSEFDLIGSDPAQETRRVFLVILDTFDDGISVDLFE